MKIRRARSLMSAVAGLGLLAAAVLPAAPALAATDPVITGVRVVASDGVPFIGSPDLLVDGSGLTRHDLTALHAPADASNSVAKLCLPYFCEVTLRTVIDLQGAYTVGGVGVWQYNSADPSIVAGARVVNLSFSMDGVNFESAPGASVDLAPGTPRTFSAASIASFSAPARYVLIEGLGHYGDYWGLSEVMFTGTPLAVPEPASFGLMGAGLVLLGAWRRRTNGRQ